VPTAYDRLPLGALRVFEAVATHLNFSAAADALYTVSYSRDSRIDDIDLFSEY
jgi:hypothetical protein